MADVPAGESAWRFTVQILRPSEEAPACAPSCSLLADPSTRLHELAIEHNGAFPIAARHLHFAVSASATIGECLTDPPLSTGDGTEGTETSPLPSDDERSHLVADLARSISMAAADETVELRRFASRAHHRLALLRGVFPEPPALQASSWLSTRAYIARYLEELVLDSSASV